jgi:ankyrin repeat protein
MDGIWRASSKGNLAEVERLVGHGPGLLEARRDYGKTPLMFASSSCREGVVRWLLDKAAE